MKLKTLTPTEESLMKILWSLDVFYLKDVLCEHPEPKPHQNTISTYLKLLSEKGFIDHTKEGRIFKYFVKIAHRDYKIFLIEKTIEQHFHENSDEFVHFLLDQNIIRNPRLKEKSINSKKKNKKTKGKGKRKKGKKAW
ncbi:MAG: BlaI/MecI/CopY family transcriptional regulator [Bergeyella sp.]|nr:BlaI/MecI/CopY family transcriptional regulator [Bergeyella sp.]